MKFVTQMPGVTWVRHRRELKDTLPCNERNQERGSKRRAYSRGAPRDRRGADGNCWRTFDRPLNEEGPEDRAELFLRRVLERRSIIRRITALADSSGYVGALSPIRASWFSKLKLRCSSDGGIALLKRAVNAGHAACTRYWIRANRASSASQIFVGFNPELASENSN